ncbi:MAG: DNA damage-inducible protein D [Tannerellaceae bacterium]|nr:DNA damage-inducible protein D [Tannerellaceae bacterium]
MNAFGHIPYIIYKRRKRKNSAPAFFPFSFFLKPQRYHKSPNLANPVCLYLNRTGAILNRTGANPNGTGAISNGTGAIVPMWKIRTSRESREKPIKRQKETLKTANGHTAGVWSYLCRSIYLKRSMMEISYSESLWLLSHRNFNILIKLNVMSNLIANEYQGFEQIKHVDEQGNEFWLARELVPVLEYTKWENFKKVVDRAMLACRNSGFNIADHFPEVRKMVEMPSKQKKDGHFGFPDLRKTKMIIDYKLSRYACYLIVQNGDPRKEIIATGQTYFAIQTRRQEVADYFNQLDEDNKRLVVRGDIKKWNQMLAEAAHQAGVITDEEFARFQNAGYMGLYGGETVQDIHSRKKLQPKQKILDFMNSQELVANLFRISLAEEKIRNEQVQGAENAAMTHNQVGQEVRKTIQRVGGVLPEDQPTPGESIEDVQKEQLKKLKSQQKLMLDE